MSTPIEPTRELARLLAHPGGLRTVSGEQLLAIGHFLGHRHPDPLLIAEVLAESLQRAWLWGAAAREWGLLEEHAQLWASAGWESSTVAAFAGWCQGQARERSWTTPEGMPDDSPGLPLFRDLLEHWRTSSGVMPFVIEDPATARSRVLLLPFRLESRADDDAGVGDRQGQPLTGLQAAWECAVALATSRHWHQPTRACRARFPTLPSHSLHPLVGSSPTLPFLVALFLRFAGINPPGLSWAASGVLDREGRIAAVAVADPLWQAKAEALAHAGVPCRLLPQATPLGLDQALDALAIRLRPFHQPMGREQLEQTLRLAEQEMRAGMGVDLPGIVRQLQHLLLYELSEKDRRVWVPETRARAILALATALSHWGDPGAVPEVVRRLPRSCAWSVRATYHNRLAVAAMDRGRYPEALAQVTRALRAARALRGPEQLRARLTALGTRGQALTHQALWPDSERALRPGRAALVKACALAQRWDEDMRPTTPEFPRDLAYLLQWQALHQPHRAGPAFEQAWAASASCPKTRLFVQRHTHLARYRALLLGRPSLSWWPAEGVALPESAPGLEWVRVTALKYAGAWEAAHGQTGPAAQLFEEAAQWEPRPALLRLIRASLLLQAGESLSTALPIVARHYWEQVPPTLADLSDWLAETPLAARSWLRRTDDLLAGVPPSADPQRHFPY